MNKTKHNQLAYASFNNNITKRNMVSLRVLLFDIVLLKRYFSKVNFKLIKKHIYICSIAVSTSLLAGVLSVSASQEELFIDNNNQYTTIFPSIVSNLTIGSYVPTTREAGNDHFIKDGKGTMVMKNASTITGKYITIKAGTLAAAGFFNGSVTNNSVLASLNALNAGAVSDFTVHSFENNGIINLAGSAIGNRLIVNGDFVGGTNSILKLAIGNSPQGLVDDNAAKDMLVIDGGRASGKTLIVVDVQSKAGAQNINGIKLVDATNGATTEDQAFALSEDSDNYRSKNKTITIGAYDYALKKGNNNQQDEQSWYLTSAQQGTGGGGGGAGGGGGGVNKQRPEAVAYDYIQYSNRFMFMHSLYDRGNYQLLQTNNDDFVHDWSVWVRVNAAMNKLNNKNGLKINQSSKTMMFGFDIYAKDFDENGQFYFGGIGGLGSENGYTRNVNLQADSGSDAQTIGIYATWYETEREQIDGGFIDFFAIYGNYSNYVKGEGLSRDYFKADSLSLSLEAGYRAALADYNDGQVYFEPMAQIAYIGYWANDFEESTGASIHFDNDNGIYARVGGRISANIKLDSGTELRPYLEANYHYNDGGGTVFMGEDKVLSNMPTKLAELKLGVESNLTENLQVWAEASGRFAKEDYQSYKGMVGVSFKW